MSYLSRISARAVESRSKVPVMVPKGLGKRQASVVARMQDGGEEEETLAPMRSRGARPVRRQEVEGESDDSLAAAREEEEPEGRRQTDEEEVVPLRRQEEEQEELATLLRQPEEEGEKDTVQPVRRQEEGEEDVAQPATRMEDEEQAMPMRAIARQEEIPLEESARPAPSTGQADLEPNGEPASQELAGEDEPSALQALSRHMSPGPNLSPPASQIETSSSRPIANALTSFQTRAPDFPAGLATPKMPPSNTRMDETRATVVIDQLDVLIHEPVAPADRAAPRQDRDRALRARYLRRL